MKNQRYRIDNHDVVLSEEEHGKVQKIVMGGGGVVILRNGNLIINTPFIRYAVETDNLTEEQEKMRERIAKLPEPEYQKSKIDMKNHHEFYLKMEWSHSKKCVCFENGVCAICGNESEARAKTERSGVSGFVKAF